MSIYKVKSIPIKRYRHGEIKIEDDIMIVECSETNPDVWRPSQLNSFITHECRTMALNSRYLYAINVCSFLNYIREQILIGTDQNFLVLKEQGLYGLKHIHLAKYITHISAYRKVKNDYTTVKRKEGILLKFYDFLYKKKITSGKDAKIEHKIIRVNGTKKGKRVVISPFDDTSKYHVIYPSKNKTNRKLSNMEDEVWNQLLEYSQIHTPEITFGIVLQIMGGLRQGEVVNTTIEDVQIDKTKNIMTIWVQDRPELFSGRNISVKKSQTKKNEPREQVVYDFNGCLLDIYNMHLKYVAKNANDTARSLRALFIDSNGNAMSGDTYEGKFKKLKNSFIDEIEKKSPSYAMKLKTHSWGSHIGRHIFTNFLVDKNMVNGNDGTPNPTLLQIARADNCSISSQDYIDSKTIVKTASDKIGQLSKYAVNNRK